MDPGVIIMIFKNLFTKIYDLENCDDYCVKLSFINYDPNSLEFYDLLVDGTYPNK